MAITMGNTMRINCGMNREVRPNEYAVCTADDPCSQCTEHIFISAERDMRSFTPNDYFDMAIAIIVDGYEASNPVWR